MSNVLAFEPPKEPEWIVGPFTEHRVVIDERIIPGLTASRSGDSVELVLDTRFSLTLPAEYAYQTAWLVAQALAIGAGYPSLAAETKERPFAPLAMKVETPLAS